MAAVIDHTNRAQIIRHIKILAERETCTVTRILNGLRNVGEERLKTYHITPILGDLVKRGEMNRVMINTTWHYRTENKRLKKIINKPWSVSGSAIYHHRKRAGLIF